MQTRIDHLVIGSANLKQGVDYVKASLGADMPFGGVHTKMGTHNHLMQLGGGVFLEIIAIKPDINPPDRPRWFGLDEPLIQRQIEIEPNFLTWVVNTDDLKALQQRAAFSLGAIEKITRGKLNWFFGLPRDGRLLAGGILPYAIEWQTDRHPSEQMADLDCSFQGLEIYHPCSTWLQSALKSIGAQHLVTIYPLPRTEAPYLNALINTPLGLKQLSSKIIADP